MLVFIYVVLFILFHGPAQAFDLINKRSFSSSSMRSKLPYERSLKDTGRYCTPRSPLILKAIQNILSSDDFQSATTLPRSTLPSIIDFQKSKCKPCVRIAPDFDKLSEKYKDVANFFKVDGDSSPEALALMKANGIRSVPTFQIWKDGNQIESIQGAHLDEVEMVINQINNTGNNTV